MQEPTAQERSVAIYKQMLALAVPVCFCIMELQQWWSDEAATVATFVFHSQTFPYLAWLCLFPFAWLVRRHPFAWSSRFNHSRVMFMTCFGFGLAAASGFGWSVRDLPYAYHDEYSYLFQAQTFAQGRVSFPSPPLADAFAQVHVLTDPVFASRYFPGTGALLAPFTALDHPIWGWWIYHGMIAGFVALAGRELSPSTGWVAGILVACSPGMVLLANLLLSPPPTMLCMTAFYGAYFRFHNDLRCRWAVLAGLSIGIAFLCRPLTAVGLGYPFALHALYELRPAVWANEQRRTYVKRLSLMVLAFGSCVIFLALHNRALTGDFFTSPYGIYTARFTPSHVYGFYNRQRGMAQRTTQTDLAYDEWSEDLTWPLALQLDGERIWGLVRWSLGAVGVFTLVTVLVLCWRHWDGRILLLVLSIIGLILAYTPYGHPGMFGWGYLFEAMPALLICLAAAARWLVADWNRRNRPLVGTWWQLLWIIALAMNLYQNIPAVFSPGSEMVYPRQVAARQAQREKSASKTQPILVVIQADRKQSLHSTYVYNRPTLDGPVVRAWYQPEQFQALLELFPERAVYLYRPATDTWQFIRPPVSAPSNRTDNHERLGTANDRLGQACLGRFQ